MKRKFTLLIAALALLTMIVQPGRAWGQTTETEDVTLSSGTYSTDHIVWSFADGNITIQQMKGTSTNAVNSNYIAAPRVYKGHYLSFVCSENYAINSISIKCDGSYYGNSMTAGTVVSNNTVTSNTTDISATWTTTAGGSHVVSSVGDAGLPAIYIQNVASASNTQLRITQLTITYTHTSSSATATTVTIDDTGITNTDVYINTAAGYLSASVTETVSGDEVDGATVAWSSSNTGIATIDEGGVVTLVAAGTTTITASYAGESGVYGSSSASYELTVTSSQPYVQPTTIEITPNYTFWGKTGQFSGDTYDELSGSKDNVSLSWTRGTGSTYANQTAMRFYKDNTLTFTAPENYEIKSIVITFTTTKSDLIFSPEGYSLSETTGTWTGSSETVTMSRPSNASSYAQISQYVITVGAASNLLTVTYDANGATSGSVPTDDNGYESGNEVEVLGNTGNLAKAGYIWSGWCMDAEGTGTVYGPDYTTSFEISANTTLYAKWEAKTITGLTYEGTPTKTAYYSGENFDPTGLTVTATFNDNSSEDVTALVDWTPSPLTTGTTTVTGTYMEKTINVSGLTVTDAPGTENNPYTVAEAIANTPSSGNVYIQGIVSSFYNTSIVGDGSNYRYYISDDGTTTTQLLVYKGKGLNQETFTDANDLLVGDEVVIYGSLITYQNAPEVAANNYLTSWNRPAVDVEAPTFSIPEGGYATAQTVAIACATEGATIYYTLDGSTPDNNSTPYSEAIAISETTTIKAIAYVDQSGSNVSSATYYIKSAGNTHTVTEALAFESYPVNNTFVQGIVSTAPTSLLDGGLLTYYISVDGTATNQLQVYKGKGLNNVAFTAQDDIQVGDIVTIYGNVKIYNNIKEFDQGNYLVEFERPTPPADPSITFDPDEISLDAEEHIAEQIPFTYDNFEVESYQDFSIQFYDANNEQTTKPDWISVAGITGTNSEGYKVTLAVISANEGDARSTYFKVYSNVTNEPVYSNLVTLTQEAPVIPPTPGTWVLTDLADLTADDIFVIVGNNGDTYAMSNDNGTSNPPAAVKVTVTDETLSGDIDANIQWNLTYDTENGYTFYPNGNTDSWLYCTTSSSNNRVRVGTGASKYFGLDSGYLKCGSYYIGIYSSQDWRGYTTINTNIEGQTFAFYKKVTGPVPTEPSITVAPAVVTDVPAAGDTPMHTVTLENITITSTDDFEFVYCDAEGNILGNEDPKPNWIELAEAEYVSAGENVYTMVYTIATNEETTQRTGYFKIYVGQTPETAVYSNLVTVTQEGYVAPVPSITVDPDEVTDVPAAGDTPMHTVTLENITITSTDDFEFVYCDAEGNILGNEDPKPNWIELADADYDEASENVYDMLYAVAENTETTPRTGYFKIGVEQTTGTVYSNKITVTQEGATTYTVNYAANGGIGTMTDPNSPYVAGAEVTLLDNTFTAPEGMKWDSWEVKDANDQDVAVNEGKFTMPASNVTVTAQWVVDPDAPTYEWVLTDIADLTTSDIFVIVGTRTDATYSGNYAMSNDNGTSNPPTAVSVTITNNKLSTAPADNIKWNISGNDTDGYTFYPNGSTTTWLYGITDNNGVRVGTNDNKLFTIEDGYLKNAATSRYFGVYQNKDWRCYTSHTGSNNNIKDQTFGYFKRQVASTDPVLYTEDVDIASDATAGAITYTLENPVTGGALTAEITAGNEGNWLTLGTVGTSIPFTCLANTASTTRTATVTLTYTYNTNETKTATAVVTQAEHVIDYATVPFDYDGNALSDLPTGLSTNLTGSYSSSPKMKFDDTGKYLILKLNEAPVSLSYDIKGNSFSGSSQFDVFVSEDGQTYELLATYTTENVVNNKVVSFTHIKLASSIRYIKWIYTNKDGGNIGLGNIHASDEYDIYGDITINSDDLAAQPVTVHDGSVVTFVGTNTNPADLIIEDGGQVIVSTETVAATVQKTIADPSKAVGGWYTIASPVIQATPESVTNLVSSEIAGFEYDLYLYDEANAYWRNYHEHPDLFTKLDSGRGYLYYNNVGADLEFKGILKAANVVVGLTCENATLPGFNLIGNPFSHNIYKGTGGAIENSKLAEGYYTIENGSVWSTKLEYGDAIKPGQAILVQATENFDLTIVNTTNAATSKANNDNIMFAVANGQYEDVTYALFKEGIGLNKINHRDDKAPMLYIPQNGKNYAIATMGDDTQAFNLNFKAMTAGQYTLSFKAQGNYSYLHVIDRLTGEDIDMLLEGEYNFIGSPRDNEARFIVKLSYNANIDATSDVFAYQNGDDIIVSGEGTLQIFDVMGRFVTSIDINGTESISAEQFNTGVYVFRMVSETVKTQKIVVR